MASIIQVGDKFRAQVRRAGQRQQTKTFGTKKDAEQWARKLEVDADSGKQIGLYGETGVLLSTAIDRYIKENGNISKTAMYTLAALKRDLGKHVIDKLTDDVIVDYIKGRKISPTFGASHFSYFGTVLKTAKIGWKIAVPDILKEASDRLSYLGLIGKSGERTRRPTAKEIELLLNFKYPTKIPMVDIIEFAISSAMRQSEIMRIRHATVDTTKKGDLNLATVVITDRKHPKIKKGNHKVVPLLKKSLEIIGRQKQKKLDDRIFPYDERNIGRLFWVACKELGIEDLRFHDLRHEGASRLFELGYKIQEVAMFTGHENWKTLQRYTHLKPDEVRQLEKVSDLPTVAIENSRTNTRPAAMDDPELMKKFEQFLKMEKMMEMMKAMEVA